MGSEPPKGAIIFGLVPGLDMNLNLGRISNVFWHCFDLLLVELPLFRIYHKSCTKPKNI